MTDTADPTKEYMNKVAVGALNMIIDLYPVEDERHGVVHVEAAIEGLALTMAMLAERTGAYSLPSKRRALADDVRKELLFRLNQLAAATKEGSLEGWEMPRPIDPKH